MKIICARFYSTALWERQERQRMRHKASLAALEDPLPQPPPRHYTSTGPSLAGAPTNQAIAEEAIYDNAAREDIMYGSGHGHTRSLAPRKASLPGLAGTGTSRQGVVPSVSMASLATTGTASSIGRAESLAIGGTKFGIAGLFGKEADEAARREKDDRKKEEKEKKAREKEQKQIEKDKKKAKRKEEEEEDEFGTGSALSWKKKNTKVASGPVAVGTPSSYDSRLPVRDTQSIADTSTVVDSEDHAGTAASVATVRPKLTISPSATPRDRAAAKTDSDSGSSLSISSPVFAHSSDSEGSYDNDIYGYGKPRQGYRYGGYNPSHMKSPQKAIHGVPNTEGDGNKSESSVGYFAGTKPAVASDSARPQRNERTRTHATTHDHRSQEKAAQKARMEDRGEWLVLDMGSEQAFNSILRIFHRHSHSPANSGFLPPSITAAMSLQSTSFNPNEVKSMPNSPIQHSFQPVSTFTRNRDTDSVVTDDRSTLGPSLSSTKATSTTAVATDINDDFDDIYVPIESTAGPSSIQIPSEESQQDLAQAFPDLSSKASFQNPTLPPPALRYPEWRTDVVHRARRYGMREAGRPLELAMYGWGRNLVEMETSAVYAKMRKKEESSRQKLRNSIALFNEIAKPSRSVPVPSWEDNSSDTDDHEEDEVEDRRSEDAGTEKDWERSDSKRRMSTVSHVSTIKANPEKAKAKAPIHLTDDEEDTDYSTEGHDDAPTERATDESDSDTVPKFEDDKFDAGYAYGLDDEEDALAEGLGSIMGDSEEESEVEWFAWTTDLPRQVIVRQQQAELDHIREEKLREERDLPEFELQPLSPMEFSNPFAGDNSSFISQNVALPTVLPPIPPPKTPEEERRQYAEKRRKLEPSAVSTSQPPPMPSLPISPRLSPGGSRLTSHHSSTSTSSLQSSQHSRFPSHNIAQGGYHAQPLHVAPPQEPRLSTLV
ncbi:hypothetical protein BDN70DRAFT_398929 [Pholiota conissans]|uniref:Uncharacterized protein n=1 Tax=Pholiota conissans TaxID=109636 RepID=A0A9P5YQI2_9AGAR|nr:hypothetical protein BDN70DRAFT_398929 [Pholiota conissans]